MNFRNALRTLFGVVLLGALATPPIGAVANVNRTTYVTFSQTVRLPGVALPAGTYIFEIINTDAHADLVRVLARDRSKVYVMQFTQTVYRPRLRNLKPAIILGEQAAGNPPTVQVWFPDDKLRGRQFLY